MYFTSKNRPATGIKATTAMFRVLLFFLYVLKIRLLQCFLLCLACWLYGLFVCLGQETQVLERYLPNFVSGSSVPVYSYLCKLCE
jgi:hypothetical protein